MKIVILNGSARKGNTSAAVDAFTEGAKEAHEITMINPAEHHMEPCTGCGACQCQKGCVAKDETNALVDQIVEAEMILFATPVYWWGMSAQLKLIIDKCYCKGAYLKKKKVGLIIVGGAPVEHMQYQLITSQFDCMAQYLDWDMVFKRSYYASKKDDLKKEEAALAELKELGRTL